MALPVFLLLIVVEALMTSSQGRSVYALKDFGGSMSQLGINILVRLAISGALISLHFFLYEFRFFDIPNSAWGWLAGFVAIDFIFIGTTALSTGCVSCGARMWFITPAST